MTGEASSSPVATRICVLTDEELTVLLGCAAEQAGGGADSGDDTSEPATEPTLDVTPYLDQLTRAQRELAHQVAERSLMVRRILVPRAGRREELPEDGPVPVELTGLLAPALRIRQGAPVVAVIDRLTGPEPGCRTAPEQDVRAHSLTRYLYLVEPAVLVEDVTPQGVHTFGLTRSSAVPELLTEILVPPEAAVGGGPEFTGPEPPADLMAALGHPTVLARATVRSAIGVPGPGPAWTLVLGPGGSFLGREVEQGTRYQPRRPAELVELLAREVQQAVEDVVAAWPGQEAAAG